MYSLSNRNILLISPEPWSHIFVSKHHYAIHLAKRGHKVYFLNPPTKSAMCLSGSGYENLTIIDYEGFLPGLRFLPVSLQWVLTRRKFDKIEQITGEEINMVWSFDNSVFYDFSGLPDRAMTISHIVDLNQDFQFSRAAKTADVCFCTTGHIRQKMLLVNPNVYHINHGLSLGDESIQVKLPGNNRKAIYVGNLAMPYLDWDILLKAATVNTQVDFVFVGPGKDDVDSKVNQTHESKDRIRELSNVFFLDKVPSKYIQSYLKAADVLLVAYQEQYHVEQANPHKMMEYLASGKPIVATFTEEYTRLNDLICMSDRNAQWPEVFRQTVDHLQDCTLPEKVHARKAFALDNTYDKQIDRIEKMIGNMWR